MAHRQFQYISSACVYVKAAVPERKCNERKWVLGCNSFTPLRTKIFNDVSLAFTLKIWIENQKYFTDPAV